MTVNSNLPISSDSIPLLKEYFRNGAKPASEWRCGLEFELFGYTKETLERLNVQQVQAVLRGPASSAESHVFEDSLLVETRMNGIACMTVEPGGQIEFSGQPQQSLVDAERNAFAYLAQLREIAAEHKLIFLGAGFDPLRTATEQSFFPKQRYTVMRPFLAARGARAWDMMHRTCAIQTNLDYNSADDLAKKFIVGNRLAPILTAIFANSPFEEGRLSNYKSTRAAVWLETDTNRTGAPEITLDLDKFSLTAFVDYALDVPMIFVRRANRYLPLPANFTFRQFLEAGSDEYAAAANIRPTWQDWIDHLSTLFTDARLKQYIELRSMDSNDLKMALAALALSKGLMYDSDALDEALRLLPTTNLSDFRQLQEAVAHEGLAARMRKVNVLHTAKEIVRLATRGLKNIAPEEVRYLDVLHEQVIEDEMCPADILLHNWHGSWHGSMTKVIEHLRVA